MLGVGLVVGIIVIAVFATARQKAKKREGLYALETLFRGRSRVDEEASTITGTIDGQSVTIRFTSRGGGSSSESWTEVDVAHGVVDVDLGLRPQGLSENLAIAAGRAIDLQTGDSRFDARFVVEGAPSDIVLRALDAPTREALLARHGRCDLTTSSPGTLRLGEPGWATDLVRARRLVTTAVGLGTRLRMAHEEVDRASRQTSAYRDAPGDGGAAERRAAELEALKAVKEQRAIGEKRMGLVILAVIFGVLTLTCAHAVFLGGG